MLLYLLRISVQSQIIVLVNDDVFVSSRIFLFEVSLSLQPCLNFSLRKMARHVMTKNEFCSIPDRNENLCPR
jgi:hypothetical protein